MLRVPTQSKAHEEGRRLRKNQALLLTASAIAVAAVIVFVGSANDSGPAAPTQSVASATSLPPGYPSICPSSSAAPDASQMIAALKAKLGKNPSDTQTMTALGAAFLASEQYDKAKALLVRALRLRPGDPEASVQLAMAYHAGGDDAKAKALIRGVLKKNPRLQQAHNYLGDIYFSKGHMSQAAAEWKKAAAIDP
jgi:cytochrome c-type biogenesis protein CcmH/NrfG